jgi:hypothetical protein
MSLTCSTHGKNAYWFRSGNLKGKIHGKTMHWWENNGIIMKWILKEQCGRRRKVHLAQRQGPVADCFE